jgi:glutamate dehydrogenase
LVSFSLKVFDLPALDELGDKPIEKILKFLQDFLNFTKKIDLNKPKVKVNCPTVENCVSGTEIFIIQRDMPFLVDSVRIELNRRGINIQTIKSTILNVIRSDDGTLVSAFATPEEPDSLRKH